MRIELPEALTDVLGIAPEALSRRVLEALLVDECVRGNVSRGKVAELLGLSFFETEDLFRSRHVPYPAKSLLDDRVDNPAVI
jgi:predicted HTH domain antitoxin